MKPCRHLLTTPTRDSFSGPLYNCRALKVEVKRCPSGCPKYAAVKDGTEQGKLL